MVLNRKRRSFEILESQPHNNNNQMMANYERLTQLLERMLVPQYIKMVEEELSNLSEDPLIVNLLVMAMRDRQLPYASKQAAGTFLNKTLIEFFHNFEEPEMIGLLLQLNFDFSVQFKLKRAIQPAFIALLELAEEECINQVFKDIGELMKSINPSLLNQHTTEQRMEDGANSASVQLQKMSMIFYVYKCIFEASNHIYRLTQHIYITLNPCLQLIPIIPHPDNYQTLNHMAEFLAAILEKLRQGSIAGLEDFIQWFVQLKTLPNWIFQIYSLRGAQGQSWISLAAQPHPTELNNLKSKTAEVQQYLMQLAMSCSQQQVIQMLESLSIYYAECRGLVNTLTVYGGCYTQLAPYQGFVTALMRCLILLYQQNRAYFSKQLITLMHQVIFPLLRIKEKEMQLFEDQPEEFQYLSEDCCDHQRFGVLKTETAQLLQCICDENNEASTYLIQHCVISLKVRLGLDPNFNSQVANFLTIETALLCMSILSYKIGKFEGEMAELRSILAFEHVCTQFSNLQMSRLFSFLAYNYGEVYINPLEGKHWIDLALQADRHPTLEIAALDFITNVVQDYFNIDFLLKFSQKTVIKGTLHLNALIKMISVHLTKIPEADMMFLIDILFKVAIKEIQHYDRKIKSHTMDINNIVKTFQKIVQKEHYLANKPNLAQKMWQIIELLPLLKNLNLDDNLVRIIAHLIYREENISQNVMVTVEPFTAFFRQDRHNHTAYLMYYNAIALKGHPSIAAHIVPYLFEALDKCFKDGISDIRATRGKVAVASIHLIFQNILAVHGNDLPGELIDQFAACALRIIPDADNPEEKHDLTMLARALNLLFLCHMYRKNDIALRRMLLFQDSTLFYSHDLRVLCLCLSKEIMRETDIIAVTEMINLMVRAIAASKESTIPIKPKYSAMSIKPSHTKIRIKRVEDYEHILNVMPTPFPKDVIPEAELQTVIETMKTNNPYLYHTIVKSLTKPVYQKLKELMSEVIVEGKKRLIVHAGKPKENGKAQLDLVKANKTKKRDYQSGGQEEEIDVEDEDQKSKRSSMKKKRLRDDKHPTDQFQA